MENQADEEAVTRWKESRQSTDVTRTWFINEKNLPEINGDARRPGRRQIENGGASGTDSPFTEAELREQYEQLMLLKAKDNQEAQRPSRKRPRNTLH